MDHPLQATPDGTSAYFAARPEAPKPALLGKTGLLGSRVGFGAYRIQQGQTQHAEALRKALLSGCNLIDTSANYSDGGSERLIGDVLTELFDRKELSRDQVIVVTKAGYIQGGNLDVARQRTARGQPFPEIVRHGPDLWHCISPEFLADQLTRSLGRLGLKSVDALLLHNPEYYLGAEEADHAEYYRRIERAFEHLEQEAGNGRIAWYGVSSNSFPSAREEADFTSLETLVEITRRRGFKHFAWAELPFNLLEPGAVLESSNSGKPVLQVARQAGLVMLANRPLNAFSDGKLVRLADFPSHRGEDIVGNLKSPWGRAMELEVQYQQQLRPRALNSIPAGAPGARTLSDELPEAITLAHLLRQNFTRLSNIDSWRGVLEDQLRPLLEANQEILSSNPRPELRQWTQEYREVMDDLFNGFTSYVESQAAHDSDTISAVLDHAAPALKASPTLSRKALRVYLGISGVDCVLLGMRRPQYVADALGLEAPLSDEEARAALEAVVASRAPTAH